MTKTREPSTYATEYAARLTAKFSDPANMRANHVHSITVEAGSKYDRLIVQGWMPTYGQTEANASGRSCHAFVERETGLLIKSGGWAGPAKGKKGLLWNFDLHTDAGMDCAVEKADPFGGYLYSR